MLLNRAFNPIIIPSLHKMEILRLKIEDLLRRFENLIEKFIFFVSGSNVPCDRRCLS